jgi:hypothetical protein
MRVISEHFGQGGAKLTDQTGSGLKNILTELQGLRVSFAAGVNAGSSTLTDGSATVTANDTLLAVAYIKDSGSFSMESDVCSLVAGSTNNIAMTSDLSGGDLLVFWFDQDNTSVKK